MNNKSNNTCPNNSSESKQLLKSWLESNNDCDSLCEGKIFSGPICPESQ